MTVDIKSVVLLLLDRLQMTVLNKLLNSLFDRLFARRLLAFDVLLY